MNDIGCVNILYRIIQCTFHGAINPELSVRSDYTTTFVGKELITVVVPTGSWYCNNFKSFMYKVSMFLEVE